MLRGKRWFGVALALMLVPTGLSAQTATIMGSVRSQAQAPVRGAYVMIPGLEVSTLTTDAGAFLLVIPADRARGQQETLVVQQIGYRTQEITVTVSPGVQRRDIILQEEAITLDEVVVTGTVGRQERRAQSAVVASIDAARTAQVAPVTSVSNLLQARVPGVSVQQSSGTSGTAQSIRIRGAASISLSNEPLVFIDGIRADSRNRQIYGVGGQGGTRLNDLRPDDIESIEIVKGPAAATLYGADASAGVIQIITKKGRPGGGFSQSVSLEYNTFKNEWTPPDNWGRCTANDVANANQILCHGKAVGTVISDNPLMRENVFETGNFRSLSWSGRGGGDNYGVYVSFGADQEIGMVPNNEIGRMSGGFSFDFLPHERVRIESGFRLLRNVTSLPNNDNNIYGYLGGGLLGTPRSVGLSQNGWYGANRQKEAIANIMTEDNSLRVMPRVAVNYSPADWFTHRLSVGADLTRTQASELFPKNLSGWYGTADLNSGQIGQSRESANRITVDYLGNVTRHLSDALSADLSFGGQVITTSTDLTSATGIGLITNEARSVSAAAQRVGTQNYSEYREAGVFSQLGLAFQDRLFLQAGARLDKHSSFGSDAKMFLSPKIGVSYVISEEGFWQNSMPDFFGTFRLRGAYGTTGRAPSSGALWAYDTQPYAIQSAAGGTAGGIVPLNIGNKNLEPEKGSELELGFDASFFDERLGLELTYFDKKTTNLILNKPLPASLGYTESVLENIGAVSNKGFELAANANLVTLPDFTWSLRAAVSTLDHKVTDMGGVSPFGTMNRVREGAQVRAFHTYTLRKVEQNCQIDVGKASEYIGPCGIVSDTLEFVGNLLPTFEGTFASTFTIKGNVQLYAQLDRKSDFYIYNNTAQFRERQMGTGEKWVRRDELLSQEEQIARFGPFVRESAQGDDFDFNQVNGAYIEPGDFWRLREVSLTYTLPTNIASTLFARGASVTLAGRNLWLSTKYSGSDPELYAQTTSTGREDFLTMPTPRRWVARINLQF